MIDNLNWRPIDLSVHNFLCARFEEMKIRSTILSFKNNKAPSPYGFPLEFYKSSWTFLKNDIMEFFNDFHSKGVINKNVNNTFISLIVKKKDYSLTSNFRPISLTTSLYKIVPKVLANRLKRTLPNTVVDNQFTFVNNRQITYAILSANEAVDYWKARRRTCFVFKIDLEKAFDTINWKFNDLLLIKKNCPHRWRKWIKACITGVQYSIIINGQPKGRIIPKRGLRQGNPLSPFIFVLALDYLSAILNHLNSFKVVRGGVFKNNCNINHILYTYDILIFVEDNDMAISNLRCALNLFEKAFGLSINNNKSTISPINVPNSRFLWKGF